MKRLTFITLLTPEYLTFEFDGFFYHYWRSQKFSDKDIISDRI
ncbi:MAG: hypothetical protein ACFCU5_18735 [Pleurocapsa sp.]